MTEQQKMEPGPSYNVDMDEISIPDVEGKFNNLTFKYSGWKGFSQNGHAYNADLEHEFRMLEPVRTPTGRIAKHQPRKSSIPHHLTLVGYWKAQCIFRGLPTAGKIDELKHRLRPNMGMPMIQELKELQKKLYEQYEERMEIATRDWEAKKRARREAELAQTKELLQEYFPTGVTDNGSQNRIIMVKLGAKPQLHEAAASLGLASADTDHPLQTFFLTVGYTIIGRSQAIVNRKLESLKKKKEAKEKARIEEKRREAERKVLEERRNYGRVVNASAKGSGPWTVDGTYSVKFPYIQKHYCQGDIQLTLQIGHEETKNGVQMYAIFDFGIISGVMRFETKESAKRGQGKTSDDTAETASKKRKRDEYDYYGWYSDDPYDSDNRTPTPEAFYLSPAERPSLKSPTWSYRWRGRDIESIICVDSDKKLFEITFGGPAGTEITGAFGGDLVPDGSEFTGIKTSMAAPRVGSWSEWHELNETGYDRECAHRWC
ncbi:hypothetical protein B0O99DRAFT_607991 [Bisporella sp. PMI_857]|nr:hypothetical protein B0O99DRAFT_607991 [Bisporella sp. PMI_857]